ncbi:hypothetical protein FDG2_1170 [Candidatus Protofrankia californiensis]|uniref:Uncharacterized protein n=1 Tax=Candidatus Protofrankia californiensis TaxID=1839754 RepID=A0A1C3NUY6_9ACTN|nr:hypothetical protein FDG2_1170 [Candidatus Protofrankia californiensis]
MDPFSLVHHVPEKVVPLSDLKWSDTFSCFWSDCDYSKYRM